MFILRDLLLALQTPFSNTRLGRVLQGRTVMPLLPAGLAITFAPLAGLLTVRIRGGRLAAVLAVEGDAVEQAVSPGGEIGRAHV